MANYVLEQLDSLEDWVAIRNNPFDNASYQCRKRLKWHVAWNNFEEKVSVTCRECKTTYNEEQEKCWANAFSLSQLSAMHDQIALIYPQLSDHFPANLREPRGVWSYLGTPELRDEDSICRDITRYMQLAYDVSGHKIFMSCFFDDSMYDDCFEAGNILKRNALTEEITKASDQLSNINFLRSNALVMRDMIDVYEQEDKAIMKWQQAYAELHINTMKPFIEMRELAYAKLKEAKEGLCNPHLGERRKKEFAKQFSEWNYQWITVLEQIQELYIEYYGKTADILTAACERISVDKKKFGSSSFESICGPERLQRLQKDLHHDKVQLIENSKLFCQMQRDKAKQEIAAIEESPDERSIDELIELEEKVFKWQSKCYEEQLKLLQENERYCKFQLQILTEIYQKGKEEEMFHDAVEDPSELGLVDECEERKVINARIQKLKTRLTSINTKRAQIRDKQTKCEDRREKLLEKRQLKDDTKKKHHRVQMKLEEKRLNTEKNREFIEEQRKKAVERLRQYKLKQIGTASVTLKTDKTIGKSGQGNAMVSANKVMSSPTDTAVDVPTHQVPPPPSVNAVPIAPPLPPVAPPPPPIGLAPPPPPPPLLLAAPLAKKESVDKIKQTTDVKNNAPGQTVHFDLSSINAAKLKLKTRPVDSAGELQLGTKTNKESTDPILEMKNLFQLGVKLLKPVANRADSSIVSSRLSTSSVLQPPNDLQSILQRGLASKSISNVGYSDDDSDTTNDTKEFDSD